MTNGSIAGLILAAGESSRMASLGPLGTDKALLRYRGRTFLEGVLANLREAGVHRLVVVLGHHAEQIQQALDLRSAEVVVNHDYRRGQTSSLQAGLRALAAADSDGPAVEGLVLSLVDHPAVTPATVRALIAAFHASSPSVVFPTFQNRRGHPTLIARALFPELLALSTDEGANTVIRRQRDSTREVGVNDPGILNDVDDPEAYRRLEQV